MKNKKIILDKIAIENKINRIAFSIIENYNSEKTISLVGFEKNGYIIAEKILAVIQQNHTIKASIHKISLTKKNEYLIYPEIPKENIKNIFLVDDVLKSGKTIIYGIKAILNYPVENLKTIILVNRNHNKFPIGVDYVGLKLSTNLEDHIEVVLNKNNEAVYLV